jgi:hypothetical protein
MSDSEHRFTKQESEGDNMVKALVTTDFVITTVRDELSIEELRRGLGCAPVPRATVMRRFFTFAAFLQTNGLTTRGGIVTHGVVNEYSELCRSDLTNEGFAFVTACHEKWLNLMGKDAGDDRERRRLAGWLWRFRVWVAATR